MHLTVGIFGDSELAKKMGKKGTENDIAITNHASSEGVFTYVSPNSDKIQSLLQSIAMIDIPVIVAKELTKEIGEMIIAVDEYSFDKGFIIGNRDTLAPLIKGTSLEKFIFTTEEELREQLKGVKIERSDDLFIPIDNYFNVKGVGTVILGIAKSGIVKKYDKVMIEPLGKEANIKGIQSQDKDFEETQPGMRVGLNLKGVEADELRRGYIICKGMKKSDKFTLELKRNKFFKGELKQGIAVFVASGLQVVAAHIENLEPFTVKLLTPVAYKDKLIIASQTDTLPRIIGSGLVKG
jgi:selenocysteine-specific translation elongation factor